MITDRKVFQIKLLNIPFYVLCSNLAEITSQHEICTETVEYKFPKILLFDWIKVNDLELVLPRGQINQPQSILQISIYCKD